MWICEGDAIAAMYIPSGEDTARIMASRGLSVETIHKVHQKALTVPSLDRVSPLRSWFKAVCLA